LAIPATAAASYDRDPHDIGYSQPVETTFQLGLMGFSFKNPDAAI
jgi:hypothetical protein